MEEVIRMLNELGSNFDVASVYELRKLLGLGVSPDRISYGNTIKKSEDIKEFYQAGVRIYVSDSEAEVQGASACLR